MALASVCLGRKESSICSHIRMQHLREATPTLGFHEFRFRDACLVERPCSGPVSSFLFPCRVENGRAGRVTGTAQDLGLGGGALGLLPHVGP